MNPVYELERMGYRFRIDGDKVKMRRYGEGEPPEGAKELLAQITAAKVKQILLDRENGFSDVPPGCLRAEPGTVLSIAAYFKKALDAGELFDVHVRFEKSTGVATFMYWPAEWEPSP